MIKITDTVKHLIIINALFFLGTYIFKEKAYDLLAMHYFENPAFKPWQIVTHIFMHGNVQHILFNMIGLWMFGSSVEQMIGTKRFLILYFIAGIGAVLFSQGIDYIQFHSIFNKLQASGMSMDDLHKLYQVPLPAGKGYVNADFQSLYSTYNTSLVGASGALYGVMVAFGVLLPRAKMGLMFLPIMIEARFFIPLLLLSDILFGVFSVNSNIGHFAHVGGAIFGFLVIWYYKKQFENKRFR
jgi:membrane associated rhomboid family serine protease